MRDPETGNSKGYAFINFASFEASDAAIDAMNGQYLSNRPISVSYSFKKDAKGERHGSAAGWYLVFCFFSQQYQVGRIMFGITENFHGKQISISKSDLFLLQI